MNLTQGRDEISSDMFQLGEAGLGLLVNIDQANPRKFHFTSKVWLLDSSYPVVLLQGWAGRGARLALLTNKKSKTPQW